jgi:hypothetical protein
MERDKDFDKESTSMNVIEGISYTLKDTLIYDMNVINEISYAPKKTPLLSMGFQLH